MEKTILILGLMSGDQIVCEVEERQGAYLCSNVLQILVQPDETSGQMRMGLMEYMPYADPDGGLAVPTNMATVSMPGKDLRDHYCDKFKLIITPPQQKIII
jgi:hypothetical protein